MVFSSVSFLFFLLPLTLGLYYLSPRGLRNAVLLVTGLIFYLWGAGEIVGVLVFSILANWGLGLRAQTCREGGNERGLRRVVWGAVLVNIGILVYFKYTGFGVRELNRVSEWLTGHPVLAVPEILLPIGVSFFTFQALSYVWDVARGRIRALENVVDFGMYLAMFFQLVAGPIVRVSHIAGQIRGRRETWEDLCLGAVRFAHGLAKKVLIADSVGVLADLAFRQPAGLPPALAWMGLLAFAIQLYFDFSGYSDMAIGLGRMFGFRLPENFRRPYSALSVTEFWQRWHITLTTWFRDYVYLPLVLRRRSDGQVYVYLFLVFVLIGFWHGAKWTFIVFGVYHAVWLCWERFARRRLRWDLPGHPALRRAATFLVILLPMVWFRAESLGQAWAYFGSLFGATAALSRPPLGDEISGLNLLALALGSATLFFPRDLVVGRMLTEDRTRWAGGWRLATASVLLAAAVVLVVSRKFEPFIYFRF